MVKSLYSVQSYMGKRLFAHEVESFRSVLLYALVVPSPVTNYLTYPWNVPGVFWAFHNFPGLFLPLYKLLWNVLWIFLKKTQQILSVCVLCCIKMNITFASCYFLFLFTFYTAPELYFLELMMDICAWVFPGTIQNMYFGCQYKHIQSINNHWLGLFPSLSEDQTMSKDGLHCASKPNTSAVSRTAQCDVSAKYLMQEGAIAHTFHPGHRILSWSILKLCEYHQSFPKSM